MTGMTRPKRSRLTPDERQAQILDVAFAMAMEHDIEDVSVQSVAHRAGVTPGLLFHYFGSQVSLRHRVLRRLAQSTMLVLEPDPALSPAEQLRRGLEEFVAQADRHPKAFLAVARLAGGGPELRALHREVRSTFADWIIKGLVSSGAPATPTLSMGVSAWLAFVEEYLVQWLDDQVVPRAALLDHLERSGYAQFEVALADPERWPAVVEALHRRP